MSFDPHLFLHTLAVAIVETIAAGVPMMWTLLQGFIAAAMVAPIVHLFCTPLVLFVAAVFHRDALGHGLFGTVAGIQNTGAALAMPALLALSMVPWLVVPLVVAQAPRWVWLAGGAGMVAGVLIVSAFGVWCAFRHLRIATRQLSGQTVCPSWFDIATALGFFGVFHAVALLAARHQACNPEPSPAAPFEPIQTLPDPSPPSWDFASARTVAMRPSVDAATVGIPLRWADR